MRVEASQPFEAVFGEGTSGLVGTVEVAVIDNDDTVVIGPTSGDIAEAEVAGIPTGVYVWNCPAAPADLGQYTIVWSPDGTWDPVTVSTPDDLEVVAEGATSEPDVIPSPSTGGPSTGPATSWTTSASVALCCSADVGTETSAFDTYVDEASQVLFELSGRRFYGLAQKTVRPLCQPGCGCGVQVLSRGHVIGNIRWGTACNPSRVLLSGYPVREITQVKIDGDVVDPGEYDVDDHMWARRKNNERWPTHQNMTLDDTEEGTWSITYTYGQNPPLAGVSAANQLACELYKSCDAGSSECALPTGVTRVIRQGIVIERMAFAAWGLQGGIWRTGMTDVDEFLNAYNRRGMQQRPVFWSPSGPQYAPKLGA